MRRLTEHEIREQRLPYEAWEQGLFKWLWDDGKPVRFFHSPRCLDIWKEKLSAEPALLSCPYCHKQPEVKVQPPSKEEPWCRLGEWYKYSCPNGHLSTRFHYAKKAIKAWNHNARHHELIMEKAEMTKFARAR